MDAPQFSADEVQQALHLTTMLCARFEGLRLSPYLCPAGVATIGLGSTRYADGRAVALLDAPITRDDAYKLLELTLLRDYLPAVLRLCPGVDSPQRLAALTDFAYNVGVGALKASTLRRLVNAGAWSDVPRELLRWVRGGGRELPGLVKRRIAEGVLVEQG